MTRKTWVILLAILFLGFLLRSYKLSANTIYGDELTMAYDTYSILKTGKDATGKSWPITFAMGAGRPGGYIYGSLPFVAMFGPSVLGVRGLSLLSGLGVIVLMYFLGRKLFSEKVGIISSFIVAVSPWGMALSRAGFEAHFALFLALLGVTTFLYAGREHWLYIVSAFCWGMAIHTYPTFKLTLPLILLLLFWFVRVKGVLVKSARKYLAVAIVLGLVFVGVAVGETLQGRSEERFLSINVFSREELREELIQKVNYERTINTFKAMASVFHNKPVEYFRILRDSYLENFSVSYLFLEGDGNPRHNPAEVGAFYLVELVFISFAVVTLFRGKKGRELKFLIIWISVVPLATMLLLEQHSLRNALMFPAFALLSAVGLAEVMKNRSIMIGMGAVWLVQFTFVLNMIYFVAPTRHANFWSREAYEAVLYVMRQDGSEEIILSDKIDNIEYAYPVYAKVHPQEVIDQYGKYPKKYGNVIIGEMRNEK